MRLGRSVSRWEDSRMITVCDANSLMTYCKDSVTCASLSVTECVCVCLFVLTVGQCVCVCACIHHLCSQV